MTVKGIEVAGIIYDNEDETARTTATEANQTATQASQSVTQVQTTLGAVSEKTDLAYAETMDNKRNIGDLAWLETATKDDLVAAINELVTSKSKVIIKKGTVERSNIPAGWDAFDVRYSEPFPNDNIIVMIQPPEDNYVMTVAVSGVAKSEFRVTTNSRESGNGIFHWTAICVA